MQNNQEQDEQESRLPYEKPGVISEEVFETLALSCHSTNPIFCSPGTEPGGS